MMGKWGKIKLGAALRALREKRALYQHEVAAQMGVDRSRVSRMESMNDHDPRARSLFAYLQAVDADLYDLQDALGIPRPLPPVYEPQSEFEREEDVRAAQAFENVRVRQEARKLLEEAADFAGFNSERDLIRKIDEEQGGS